VDPPPVVVVPVVDAADPAGLAEVVGNTVDADEPLPRVTMPLGVTPLGVAAVCATAGKAAATATNNAQQNRPVMPFKLPLQGPDC
jgi:hypothetical protein